MSGVLCGLMQLSKAISELSGGDLSLFTTVRERLDPAWVDEIVAGSVASEVPVRRRKMPAGSVLWLVAGANLFAHMSFTDVMRHLGLTARTRRGHEQASPNSGSIAEARQRLGWVPVAAVFRKSATLWNDELMCDDFRFHGLQVLAADGVCFNLPDTPSNVAHFGKPGSSSDGTPAAWAQARAVVLVDVHHHLAFDAEVGPYRTAEIPLLVAMMGRIPDRSLLLLDRGFRAFGALYKHALVGQSRHWLLRARRDLKFKVQQNLGPGDDLVTVAPGWSVRSKDPSIPKEVPARLLRFSNGREQILLLTSLVDAATCPASEVAALYLRRWDVEMAFDDMKTEQRGAARTLRSRTPDGVLQELFGVLLAHNIVRVEMGRAAVAAGLPPTRISFHRSLAEIRRFLVLFSASSAPGKALEREAELRAALAYLILPERRDRHYPRALKSTTWRYARKRATKKILKPALSH